MSNHAVPRYGTIDTDYGMQLATTAPDQDGPVWMVNLMKYRDVAEYADGRESSISGSEADDLYSPLDSLAAVGARPVLFGDVDQQLLGEDTVWDRIGVVKYPTRKSFIDMQALPNVQGIAQTQRRRHGQHDRDGNPADRTTEGATRSHPGRLGRRASSSDQRRRPRRGGPCAALP